MGDGNTLRHTGRPRRVQDIGGALRSDRGLGVGIWERGETFAVVLQREERAREPVERGARDQQLCSRALELGGQPRGGVIWMQRHVCAARLEDSEHRGNEVRRALQTEADGVPHRDASLEEQARDRVGAAVELVVCQTLIAGHQRERIGGAQGVSLEQLVDRRLRGRGARLLPFQQRLAALCVVEQRELVDRAVGVGDDLVEQLREMARHALDRGRLEQVGAVLPDRVQAALLLVQIQAEVELRRQLGHLEGLAVDVLERELQRGRHDELVEDLEDRVPAGIPLGCGRQAVERQLLVGDGIERRLASPRHELTEARTTGEVASQGEHVREQAHRPLELDAPAVVDRGPDHEVLLARVAVQEDLQRGEHRHEEARARLAAERAHFGPDLGRDRRAQPRAAHARRRWPRPVDGELDRGRPRQACAPVLEFLAQNLLAQPRALPAREVGVLHRRRKRGLLAGAHRGVQGRELGEDHALGPVVADDVVGDELQHVGLGTEREQLHAQQRPASEIERHLRRGAGQRPRVRLLAGLDGLQRQLRFVADDLHRSAVSELETRAQALVSEPELAERASQGGHVEWPVEPQRPGDVRDDVAFAGLVDEPKALLGVGAARQLVLLRGARNSRRRSARSRGIDQVDQRGERRGSHERAQLDLDLEARAGTREQGSGADRVAARDEEVILRPGRRGPEKLAPDRRELLLGRAHGRGQQSRLGRCHDFTDPTRSRSP